VLTAGVLGVTFPERHAAGMIVTHTQNAQGQRRLYLGGKSSLECWIEPAEDGVHWSFHVVDALNGNQLADEDRRACLAHHLMGLSTQLGIDPLDLALTPYEVLASAHTANPFEHRRMALPRSKAQEHGYMATAPNIRRPATDFCSPGGTYSRRR
jgi:hypothetical protein